MKFQFKSLMKVAMIAVFSVFVASCAGRDVLNPTGTVPAGLSADQIHQAISQGCKDHEWTLAQGESDNVYYATHTQGKLMAKVKITVGVKEFTIDHAASTGFSYDEDTQKIHRRYLIWVKNLHASIQKYLNFAAASK